MANRDDYDQIEKLLALATSNGLHMGTYLAAARAALGRSDYNCAARYSGWAAESADAARKHAHNASRLTM